MYILYQKFRFSAISSEIARTLQCDKLSFLLINPFARLIADSTELLSIESITVSEEDEESPSDEFFEGIES